MHTRTHTLTHKFAHTSVGMCRASTAKLKEVMKQGVTHSLGRHDRILLRHKKPRLSTSGSNQDKSLWDHYCGKSVAMRTHDSNQATRAPTAARLALVFVDSNSTRMAEARVEGARSAIFCETRSSDPIHHIHTHSNIRITLGVRVACECCARATPLRHVYTVGKKHHLRSTIEMFWGNDKLECPFNYWLVRWERHERRHGWGRMHEYVT